MKRRNLLKRISHEARTQRISWHLAREGADHSIFLLDGLIVTVPRHTEINRLTALGIFKRCEIKFGLGWWK